MQIEMVLDLWELMSHESWSYNPRDRVTGAVETIGVLLNQHHSL